MSATPAMINAYSTSAAPVLLRNDRFRFTMTCSFWLLPVRCRWSVQHRTDQFIPTRKGPRRGVRHRRPHDDGVHEDDQLGVLIVLVEALEHVPEQRNAAEAGRRAAVGGGVGR